MIICNVSMLKVIESENEFPFLSVSDDVRPNPGSIIVGLTCLEFKVAPTFGLFKAKKFLLEQPYSLQKWLDQVSRLAPVKLVHQCLTLMDDLLEFHMPL